MAYDVFKDTYKIYADGEKVVSGSWSENPNVSKNKRVNRNATIMDQLTIISLVGTHNIWGIFRIKIMDFGEKKILEKLKKIFFNYVLNTDFQQNFSYKSY